MANDALVQVERPAAGTPEGALILLHGRGADEHDLQPVLNALDPERRLAGLTVGGPLFLPPGGRHWYIVPRVGYPDHDTFTATYAQLTAHLDGWLAEQGLDWSQSVIGGFSQGAVMSYSVGLGPGRPSPAGILAMSGFIPVVDGWHADLDGRAGLPVLIEHGRQDPIMEIGFGRRANDALSAAGLDVTYLETDAAHHIDPRTVPDLQRWVRDRIPARAV
ncbi:MAG: phospholipase [Solirubrobacteraceae bacterium]|nr:phospholipase [Solirubrobacteraceae bacterium]